MRVDAINDNVTTYIKNIDYVNPWENTILENYYNSNPASRGSKGEKIVSAILTNLGYDVKDRESKNTGHDRIINGVKTEIKFALAAERNTKYGCIFNHVGMQKDWDEIIFCCINGDLEIRIIKYTKDNLPMNLFNTQQGGKNSNNDDYMCNSTNSKALLFHENATIIL